MAWREDDEALLQRLEDEVVVQRLFSFYAGQEASIHRRAGGLVAELRRGSHRGAAEIVKAAALGGDIAPVAALVDDLVVRDTQPALLHHLALFHGTAAAHLAPHLPDRAARGWTRALTAWIALGEQHTYLDAIEDAVLGPKAGDARIPPAHIALELLGTIARHADRSARDLTTAGRGALTALGNVEEAARAAGASVETTKRLRGAAQRHRNAAIEAALAVTSEALDEASVRDDGKKESLGLLLRAVAVWGWTSNDEAVEHFVVDRLDKIGWVLYRARGWTELRDLLAPFRPMIDNLARRVIEDPGQIAYASGCAQMFVFLSEVERNIEQKIVLAERAVTICPTHRNGRLVLAAFLCQSAQATLRTMTLFARRDDLLRCEAMIARAAQLYPQATELEASQALLAEVKKGRLAV